MGGKTSRGNVHFCRDRCWEYVSGVRGVVKNTCQILPAYFVCFYARHLGKDALNCQKRRGSLVPVWLDANRAVGTFLESKTRFAGRKLKSRLLWHSVMNGQHVHLSVDWQSRCLQKMLSGIILTNLRKNLRKPEQCSTPKHTSYVMWGLYTLILVSQALAVTHRYQFSL